MGHTMREVAKRAGVCPATVSRVLNDSAYTSPQTRARVLKVIRQLNYFKNVHARRLSTGRSDLFGLVISTLANPYFPEAITGFQGKAWDQGVDVLLCNTEYDMKRTRSIIRKLIESDVRGVAILTTSVDKTLTSELTAAGIGVVLCNLNVTENLISNITINYRRGILQAVDHVARLGHRRAAIIAGPKNNHTAVTIRRELTAGLRKYRIHSLPIVESPYGINAGAFAVQAILKQSKIPTVIFCGSDLIALGAMSALEESSIRIPDDVSVIGIDDIPFASLARPSLTSIRVPREELGATAFEALQKMLRPERPAGAGYFVETELVIRKSTAAPQSGRISVEANDSEAPRPPVALRH